jgi:glutamate-1-semialdehyde 2,1-aminomutase
VWDADGRRYLDLVGSWGPMILGHRHPAVVARDRGGPRDGTSFGAPTEAELELAERVVDRYPGRRTPALRQLGHRGDDERAAGRARRHRPALIVKFAGGYHGHADGLLVAAGSGAVTTGVPSSAGVPAEVAALTLVAPYNDAAALGGCSTDARRRRRRRDRRAGRRQHGRGRADAGVPRALRDLTRATARCWWSTR